MTPHTRPGSLAALAAALAVALLTTQATGTPPGTAAEPAAAACPGIRHEIITVRADRDDWTSARLRVHPNDVILVHAGGRLAVGPDAGRSVSAKGLADGSGALEMKVGTGTVVPAGTRWFGSFRDYGTLKFRVAAIHRAALTGSYQVNLVVIAAESLPETIRLDDE